MNERRSLLLKYIVEGYTHTTQPVGSKIISQEAGLQVSPATIRNEMALLEEEGYITQPHTSAGRIPTIKGIDYYIDQLLDPRGTVVNHAPALKEIFKKNGIKGVAKEVAAIAKVAVIVAHGTNDYYYTGFSHLFSVPELTNYHLVRAISVAVDKLDSVLPLFLSDAPGKTPKVYLGEHNPLGDSCVVMFVGNERDTIFGLLTPLCTDYRANISLLENVARYL